VPDDQQLTEIASDPRNSTVVPDEPHTEIASDPPIFLSLPGSWPDSNQSKHKTTKWHYWAPVDPTSVPSKHSSIGPSSTKRPRKAPGSYADSDPAILQTVQLINSGPTQLYRCDSTAVANLTTTKDILPRSHHDIANLDEKEEWIYRIKRNEDDSTLKYKSRLCAC
jgi:hypothetical protein